jgi:hypothetical protein
MFHKSKLEQFEHEFPHDAKGHVPHPHDRWHEMQFEVEGMDPHEEGISEEEKNHRIEYLNNVWWPQVIQRVEEERQRLEAVHGETFIAHWKQLLHHATDSTHGFGVEGPDFPE